MQAAPGRHEGDLRPARHRQDELGAAAGRIGHGEIRIAVAGRVARGLAGNRQKRRAITVVPEVMLGLPDRADRLEFVTEGRVFHEFAVTVSIAILISVFWKTP